MREPLIEAFEGNGELADALIGSLSDLFSRDERLLRVNVNERSITHRLAMYMQARIEGWDVDAEYNRNHDDPKVIPPLKEILSDDTEGTTVYPDIIVHRRNTNENLLVI
jgi:hypothetical protein